VTFRVRVGCDACTGTDEFGCFDGGYGWLQREAGVFCVDNDSDSAHIFARREEAEAAIDSDIESPWWGDGEEGSWPLVVDLSPEPDSER
jgi:hypothetical protein